MNLGLGFEYVLEFRPNETVRVSSILDLDEYCPSRSDNFKIQDDQNVENPGLTLFDVEKVKESLREKDRQYYSSGELTAYIVVGVLSSLLLMVIVLGVFWYLRRKKRKEERHYSLTMRKSARRIEDWTRKESNSTVAEWHQSPLFRNTLESTASHPALTDDTWMDTPRPSICLNDQQLIFSQDI